MLYFMTQMLLSDVVIFSVIVAFEAGSQGDQAGLKLVFEDDLELLTLLLVSTSQVWGLRCAPPHQSYQIS